MEINKAERFERLGKIGEWFRLIIELFGAFDWTKIQPIFDAVAKFRAIDQEPGTADDKARILAALEIGRCAAELTPNTVDDQLSAAVTTIVGDDALLEIFARLLDNMARNPEPVEGLDWLPKTVALKYGGLNESDAAAIEAAGIDWAVMFALAKMILDLIKAWRDR